MCWSVSVLAEVTATSCYYTPVITAAGFPYYTISTTMQSGLHCLPNTLIIFYMQIIVIKLLGVAHTILPWVERSHATAV